MKRLSTAAALIALLLSAVQGNAQEWTLARCIGHALENNITIKQQNIQVAQQEVALSTSRSSMLPGVSASGSQSFSFGRGLAADNTYVNNNTGSTSFSIGSDIPVFQGFRIRKGIEMDRLNLAAATADLDKAKDDIRIAVAQAYVQILYNNEILKVAESQVNVDSLQLERLAEMHKAGKASPAEVSQQKATLEQARLSMTQALNNLNLATLDLVQLLELPSPDGFKVFIPEVSDDQVVLESPESIYAQAVTVKPSIDAENTRLDYAKANLAYAKSARYPTLSLSGGIGSSYYKTSGFVNSSFFDQMKHNFSEYVGISLSVPVFNRFSTRNSIRSAELGIMNQQLVVENAKKTLYKEIQQAYYNATASQSKLRSSVQAAESAKEAFELVKAKYENGKANITEYNESKNSMYSAMSNLVQARYECRYQCKLLDFYKGEELDFQNLTEASR